jgi:hypothetical protein
VLQQDNEHESLADCPSAGGKVRIDAIVVLVINFIKRSGINALAYLIPILTIHLVPALNELIFSKGEQPLRLFLFPFIHPSSVSLKTAFELSSFVYLKEVNLLGIRR